MEPRLSPSEHPVIPVGSRDARRHENTAFFRQKPWEIAGGLNAKVWLPVLSALLLAGAAHAVLLDSTADPNFNTSAPSGIYLNSGWQYQGTGGVPIAPQYYLTAQHIGNVVGGGFGFDGTNYTNTAVFNLPGTDLRIFKVDGTFPFYAPLYDQSDEVGKELVVFGRGSPRGSEVNNATLRGWLWGSGSNSLRWGTNVVSAIVNGGSYGPDLLGAEFNHGAGANEAMLSSGDSGHGVFIQSNGVWKLAGINSYVDGPYSTQSDLSGAFNAALFDQNGYYGDDFFGIAPMSGPGRFYATRVSSNLGWIQGVTGIPEPSTALLLFGSLAAAIAIRRRMTSL